MGVLLALGMALRLLSPAGFMPAFERGAVMIVACPDAGPMPMAMVMPMDMRMPHHGQGGGKPHQQPCHCASAAAASGPLPSASPAVLGKPKVPDAIPNAALAQAVLIPKDRDRPPATGPPLLPA
jgi:hypothetical protein